jgi:hypothetical protein
MNINNNSKQILTFGQIIGVSDLPENFDEKSQLKFDSEKGGFYSDSKKSTGWLSSFAANIGLSFVARLFKPGTRKEFVEANKQLVEVIKEDLDPYLTTPFRKKFLLHRHSGSPLTIGSVRAFFKDIIVTSEKDLPKDFNSMVQEIKIYHPSLNEKMKEILKKDFEVSEDGNDDQKKFRGSLVEFLNQNNLLTTRNIHQRFVKKPVKFTSLILSRIPQSKQSSDYQEHSKTCCTKSGNIYKLKR